MVQEIPSSWVIWMDIVEQAIAIRVSVSPWYPREFQLILRAVSRAPRPNHCWGTTEKFVEGADGSRVKLPDLPPLPEQVRRCRIIA